MLLVKTFTSKGTFILSFTFTYVFSFIIYCV